MYKALGLIGQASKQNIQTSLYVPQPKLRYASRSQAFYCKILCMFRHVRQALLLLFILSWASLIEAATAAAFHHNLQHICGSIWRYVIVFFLLFWEILWGIVNEIYLNFHIMFWTTHLNYIFSKGIPLLSSRALYTEALYRVARVLIDNAALLIEHLRRKCCSSP